MQTTVTSANNIYKGILFCTLQNWFQSTHTMFGMHIYPAYTVWTVCLCAAGSNAPLCLVILSSQASGCKSVPLKCKHSRLNTTIVFLWCICRKSPLLIWMTGMTFCFVFDFFLQLMSEFVLPAWLCLLMDWILFKEPVTATFNQQQNIELVQSNSSRCMW